jgi:trimethylamine--corrinoid protein Co-methyltransferase
MADNTSFEQWQEAGSREAVARAHDAWKRTLVEYDSPSLDEAIEAELTEWVDRRKASFPDSDV